MTGDSGFSNGLSTVIWENGNILNKGMRADLSIAQHPVSFEHLLAEIDQARYEELVDRLDGGPGYHLIKVEDRYYVVGPAAYDEQSLEEPRQGRLKFDPAYYRPLLYSGLLCLYDGDIPSKINIFAARAPIDYRQEKRLLACILGNHSFQSAGIKAKVRVQFAATFDEIIGGVMNVQLDGDGDVYQDGSEIVGDGPTLVFDMGGGTLDFTRLEKNGTPNYQRIDSKMMGGNQAIDRFAQLFALKYPKLVEDANAGIPRDLIHQILLDKNHSFKTAGTVIDCQAVFKEAFTPLLNAAKRETRTFMRGALQYNRVLVTGGISGLLYDEIAEQIFPDFLANGVIHKTDKRDEMYLANCRGGYKMMRADVEMTLQESRRKGKK